MEGVIDMEDSILNTIKSMLGPDSSYEAFDPDIIVQINTALAILTQVGVGPSKGFHITGADETWSDFLGDAEDLDMAKTYIYSRVKMLFDPPNNSFLMNALKETAQELEWRLNVAVDPGLYNDD